MPRTVPAPALPPFPAATIRSEIWLIRQLVEAGSRHFNSSISLHITLSSPSKCSEMSLPPQTELTALSLPSTLRLMRARCLASLGEGTARARAAMVAHQRVACLVAPTGGYQLTSHQLLAPPQHHMHPTQKAEPVLPARAWHKCPAQPAATLSLFQ